MSIQIADLQNLRSTPTGMAPSSQEFFVVHAGHQTILDSRDPFARYRLGLAMDDSLDPIGTRAFRQAFGALVMEALEEDAEEE